MPIWCCDGPQIESSSEAQVAAYRRGLRQTEASRTGLSQLTEICPQGFRDKEVRLAAPVLPSRPPRFQHLGHQSEPSKSPRFWKPAATLRDYSHLGAPLFASQLPQLRDRVAPCLHEQRPLGHQAHDSLVPSLRADSSLRKYDVFLRVPLYAHSARQLHGKPQVRRFEARA